MNKRHAIHVSLVVAVLAVFGVTISAAVGAQAETKSSSLATPGATPITISDVRVTEPLRIEHRALIPEIEALATNADAVGVGPQAPMLAKVHESYTFLTTRLIPHAVAEDRNLSSATACGIRRVVRKVYDSCTLASIGACGPTPTASALVARASISGMSARCSMRSGSVTRTSLMVIGVAPGVAKLLDFVSA